jgi:transposase
VTVDKETEAEIRRLFFGEHWKKGTIVAQLGVHKDVVARVVGPHGPEPQGADPRPSVLDPYRGFVLDTLERYPTLVSTRIYDMICERGYTGSLQTLRRFVLPNRKARPREVYLRVETLAGEQSQIDWAHVGRIRVQGGVRQLYCFVLLLRYSRAIWAELVLEQTTVSLLRSLVRAALYFGGVTHQWLFDNPKSIVAAREGNAIRFQDDLVEVASRLHVALRACRVRTPTDKGYASHYTSFVRSDGTRRSATPGELSSLLLRECPCARLGVEARALVVVALGVQQTMIAPLLHGRDRDVQHARDLVSGEHPGGAQMIEAALEPVLATQSQHHLGVKGESFTGAVATLVQDDRDLLVGVALGQLLELAEDVRRRLSQLPGALRQREGEAPRGASSEADVRVDHVGAAKGDVLDKEPEHPLALPHRRLRIAPELREVGGEREDLGALLGVNDLPIGDALPLVVLLRGGERAQALVPLGFQRVRHETVVRIDLHVTAAGEIRVVPGALNLFGAQAIGLVDATCELVLDGQRHLERDRSHRRDEQVADRFIDARARDILADGRAALDPLALT